MSALNRMIEDWRAAGLINSEEASRIRTFEASRERRPDLLWVAVGLGAFALLLGLALVAAANWDRISDAAKLAFACTLTAGAGTVAARAAATHRPFLLEASLFALAAATLGGVGVLGDVYGAFAEGWQKVGLWLVLTGPALATLGVTRATAHLLALIVAWAALSLGMARPDWLAQGMAASAPASLLALSGWRDASDDFSNGLRDAALAFGVGAATFAHFAWSGTVEPEQAVRVLVRLPLAIAPLLLAAGDQSIRNVDDGRGAWVMLGLAGVGAALALAVPHAEGPVPKLVGTLLFVTMWGAIAWVAHRQGPRALIGVAVAAVAVRLLIVYFELFGSRAMTGAGLIVAGLLTIGLALGGRAAWRWLKRERVRA